MVAALVPYSLPDHGAFGTSRNGYKKPASAVLKLPLRSMKVNEHATSLNYHDLLVPAQTDLLRAT